VNGRTVQIRGCLPVLIGLLVVGALLAAAVTASLAFVVVAAVAGLLAALVRRALGIGRHPREATPAPRKRAADVTIDAEVVRPPDGDDGPPPRLE
jgi:membrane protein implicated in regulation of membrane protease activity